MSVTGRPAEAAPGARPSWVRWPGLFVVGAATSGTTTLRWCLEQHPDVFMAPGKEPHYFSRIRPSGRLAMVMPVVSTEAGYLDLFTEAGGARVVGERSTSYLWSPDAAARIHEAAPDARIVILLRDPVERAWSHHWNDAAEGIERRGFLRAVRDEMERPGVWGVDSVYIGAGFYAEGVGRYLQLFGRERVAVRFFEMFVADPRGGMRELFTWLGVDPDAADELALEPRDAFKQPRNAAAAHVLGALYMSRLARRLVPGRVHRAMRHPLVMGGAKPVMDDTIRRLLEDLYAPDVTHLSDLLGVIPPWGVSPDP